jgi:hypothetical protein
VSNGECGWNQCKFIKITIILDVSPLQYCLETTIYPDHNSLSLLHVAAS